MRRFVLLTLTFSLALLATTLSVSHYQTVDAQQRAGLTPEVIARRNSIEKELQSIAVVDRKLMVAMRDGKRMAADVYRPKDLSKKYATVFVRTPYNFNFWDVRNGVPRDMSNELDAVKRGYAFVEMNERGHFFSEGNYDILGPPLSDGDDAISWIAKQRRGCGTRRSVFRARQLVSRRRSADAFHRLDLRRTEPGAANVFDRYFAGGFNSCVEVIRSRAAVAAG